MSEIVLRDEAYDRIKSKLFVCYPCLDIETIYIYPKILYPNIFVQNHISINVEKRTQKIINSLNKTTKNFDNLDIIFEYNQNIERQILDDIVCDPKIEQELNKWKVRSKDENDYFKKMRAHWNRQKAKLLGNRLFSIVICNIFQVFKLIIFY